MWMRATSSEIPRIRTSPCADGHASTMRPKRSPSVTCAEFIWRTADSITPVTSSRAARSARLPEAATAAIASGWTNASDPGPAHDARPIRCPSRRVIPKTSAVPWDPSSATVWSIAATASSTVTSHGRPVPLACGGLGVSLFTGTSKYRGFWSCDRGHNHHSISLQRCDAVIPTVGACPRVGAAMTCYGRA